MSLRPSLEPRNVTTVNLRLRLIKFALGVAIIATIVGISAFTYFNVGVNEDSHAEGSGTPVTIYQEDFSDYTNGTDTSPYWSRDISNCSIGLLKAFEVRSNKWTAHDIDCEGIWKSIPIVISDYENVSISLNISKLGAMNTSDYIGVYYQLEGGAEILFETNGYTSGSFTETQVSQTGLNGDTLQLVVRISNNGISKQHYFDNIVVEGTMAATTPTSYFEDFNAYADGTTISTSWTIDTDSCNLTGGRKFEVNGGKWTAFNLNCTARWYSQKVDISSFAEVNASVKLSETGTISVNDSIVVSYILDDTLVYHFDSNAVLISNYDSATASLYLDSLNNQTIQVVIAITNQGGDAYHHIDDVTIQGIISNNIWTGATDRNWHTASNWSLGQVPDCSDNVHITAPVASHPEISGSAVCHSLYIEDTSALTVVGSNTLQVCGNITSLGSLTANSGLIVLSGSDQQIIEGDNITLYDLEISNTSNEGVILNSNITITNTLDMVDGLIYTGTDTVFVTNNDDGAITGYSDTCYIVGYLTRDISNIGIHTYVFPLGKAGDRNDFFATIVTTAMLGTSNITGSVGELERYNESAFELYDGEITYKYMATEAMWTLEPDVQPTAGWYNLKLGIDNLSRLHDNQFGIVKRPVGAEAHEWTANFGVLNEFGALGRKIADGFSMKTNITSFSEFGVGGDGETGLPIELAFFDASLEDNGTVLLEWATYTQVNNDYFTIERTADGKTFEEVGRIPGAGNSSSYDSYTHVDQNPLPGVSYYRLKQTDFDGQFERFNLVPIEKGATSIKDAITVNAGPNPFINMLKLQIDATYDSENPANITVFNAAGQVVHMENLEVKNGTNISLIRNLDRLPQGVYILNCEIGGEKVQTIKLIKNTAN